MERTEEQMADSYAKSYKEPVSTLTHSTRYVAEHFLKWRADKQSKSNSYGASKKEMAYDKEPGSWLQRKIRSK